MPAYNDVLKLEGLTEEAVAIDQAGQQLLELCRFEASKVEGKVPTKDYASLKPMLSSSTSESIQPAQRNTPVEFATKFILILAIIMNT